MTLTETAQIEETCQINIQTTAGGYAIADKNEVSPGEDVTVTMFPKKGIEHILINGEERTDKLQEKDGQYSLILEDIKEDQQVVIYFTEGSGEYIDPYIINASFGTKDLTGWEASAESTIVNNVSADSLEGYYLEFSEGTLKQTVTGIPEGEYMAHWLVGY